MELTKEMKDKIDSLSYLDLLSSWRFAALGDERFQGETGEYWGKRMSELKSQDPTGAVQASKQLGW